MERGMKRNRVHPLKALPTPRQLPRSVTHQLRRRHQAGSSYRRSRFEALTMA